MEVLHFVKGYPEPSPPDTRRQDIFRARDFANVDNRVRQLVQAPSTLPTSLNELVNTLLQGMTSDLQKVRSIFVWLSAQPILTKAFPDVVRPNTPEAWLKRIKQERSLFTDFFTLLCREAGVPCVIVEGTSKGAGFEVGGKTTLKVTNRWNAVYVQGAWRLINVPWALIITDGVEEGMWQLVEGGEGNAAKESVVSKREVQQDMDEFWFLTDPEDFIALCMAKDRKWQLMTDPWTDAHFLSIPKYDEGFFKSGWELISAGDAVQKAEGGRCQIVFSHPDDSCAYSLTYNLYYNPQWSPKPLPDDLSLERYVLENSTKGRRALVTRLPQDGIYKIEVAGVRDEDIIPLAQFRIECQNVGKKKPPPFPDGCSQIGYTHVTEEAGLVEPSHEDGIILAKERERVKMNFKISKPRTKKIMALMTHNERDQKDLMKYVEVNTTEDNVNVSVEMPDNKTDGDYGLSIGEVVPPEPADDNQSACEFEVLINYIFTKDKNMTFQEQKDFIQNKYSVLEAIKKSDVYQFQQAKKYLGNDLDPLTQGRINTFSMHVSRIIEEIKKAVVEAMNGSDTDELEKILADYERLVAVNSVVKQAKAMLELLRALKKDEDHDALEAALRHAYNVNLKGYAIFEKAEDRIVSHHEKVLDGAYYARSLATLKEAFAAVAASILAERIKHGKAYAAAQRLYEHLEEIEKLTLTISKLSSKDVQKIAGEKGRGPGDHMQSVLMATFILLGEKESDLWEWEFIRRLLEKRGADGVAKVMASLDVGQLTDKQVELAESHISTCRLEIVTKANPHAAYFLRWVQAIIEEKHGRDAVRHHHTQIFATTDPK